MDHREGGRGTFLSATDPPEKRCSGLSLSDAVLLEPGAKTKEKRNLQPGGKQSVALHRSTRRSSSFSPMSECTPVGTTGISYIPSVGVVYTQLTTKSFNCLGETNKTQKQEPNPWEERFLPFMTRKRIMALTNTARSSALMSSALFSSLSCFWSPRPPPREKKKTNKRTQKNRYQYV